MPVMGSYPGTPCAEELNETTNDQVPVNGDNFCDMAI